ncbi:MAG TPA: efflux RND transporter permease subunit [Myxococcales bacterium]|nr:efflux RND transporter permease subunit [Myxococcales bacterium]
MTRFSLRNPIAVLMGCIAALVIGTVSLQRMPVDLFPDLGIPVVLVGTLVPGVGVKDVEKTITYRFEKYISSVPDVAFVQSTSKVGLSIIQVVFNWGADIAGGEVMVMAQLQMAMAAVPKSLGVLPPFVVQYDISNQPVCLITVAGGGLDQTQLYDLSFNTIEPQIEHLKGVASATVNGGKVRQINVFIDRDHAMAKGTDALSVSNAVNQANLMMPAGDIKIGKIDYNLYSNALFDVIRDMQSIVVKYDEKTGTPVRLEDIGRAEDGFAIQTQVVRADGKHAVYLNVLKQPGGNTIAIVDRVREAIPHLVGLPPGVSVAVVFDQSKFIREAISGLEHEVVQGLILVVLVILLFLRSGRSTIIVSVAVPLSMAVAIVLLYFTGNTLNNFTLGGLTLALGRLVDDAIVVIENINRHLEEGETPSRAALDGASEVALPVLVSTITTVAVFLPVVFLAGMARKLFTPLAVAVGFSMAASYFVSMMVTPAACQKWLHAEEHYTKDSPWFFPRFFFHCERLLSALDQKYEAALAWSLGHRRLVVGSILGLFAASCLFVPFIGREFFPATDESTITLHVRAPIGLRIEETEKIFGRIEDEIRRTLPKDSIQTLLSNIGIPIQGRAAIYAVNTGPHSGFVQIGLVDPDKRKITQAEAVEALRAPLAKAFPGIQFTFQPGGLVSGIMNFGAMAPITMELSGDNLKESHEIAQQVAYIMRHTRGLADVRISREDDYPEFDVDIDRTKAAMMGLSEDQVSQALLDMSNGNINHPGVWVDPHNGNAYYVVTQYDDPYRTHLSDLKQTFVAKGHDGQPLLMENMASIRRGEGPIQIERKYLERVVYVSGNPVGRDLGDVASELQKKFAAQVKLPKGFELHFGGQVRQQNQAFGGLGGALLMALMFIYMLMASQFKSLLYPLIIMLAVPLGLTGVFATLWATHTTFNIESFMGIIMMVGIVVSNSVLLVDFANVLRARGLSVHDAVVKAGRTRLRPIIMTALATVVGLLPVALGLEVGSEANLPLARAVIGGLSVSTFLTLFLVPAMYEMLAKYEKSPAPEGVLQGSEA